MTQPITPRIKKNNMMLKLVLLSDPKIKGLKVEAIVPKILRAPFPIATTLKGKSSTAYNKNIANYTAIANLKINMKISSITLYTQKSHSSGFSIIAIMKEVTTVIKNKQNPAVFLGTFSIK